MIDTIVNSFDIWTDAQGIKSRTRVKSVENISLEGITSLRKLILSLAVQGKLVIQDPNDESAGVFLKQIFQDKELAISSGKIKKRELFANISNEEKTFHLPKGWEWVRLGQLIEMYNGRAFKSTEWGESGLPIVRIQNLNDPSASFNYFDGNVEEQHIIDNGTFLISWSGTPGTSFGAFIWNRGKALLNQHINKCEIFGKNSNIDFLKLSVNSCMDHLISKSQGGVGLKHVTKGTLNNLVFGFPPLAEQHRIVGKVDELMAICDKLEAEQFNNLKTHQVLVKTLLETLTQAADANELKAAWERMAAHFDTLFCTDDSIDQLKQTILQLAVMGKVVKQDPNDEPASELLTKIAKEKEKLIEEGKIKKQAPLAKISEEEKPFELPKGWEFCRLDALCSLITKGSSPKWQGVSYTENPNDVLFITSENVGSYQLLLDSKKYVELKFNDIEPKSILEKGDFLMNIVGGSIGRTAIYNINDLANINQAVCLIRMFSQYLDEQFFLHFFNSSICVSYMFDKQVDNARANLSMGNISKFVIPLPSLVEQKRIVEKVDSLFSLCDLMKQKIIKSQKLQVLLSKTIVEKAVR